MKPVFMIVFRLNEEHYLLFTEIFLDGRFMFSPLCFASLEEANALFDDFRQLILRADSPTDPGVVKQTMKLMLIYPVIHRVTVSEQELFQYVDGELIGYEPEIALLSAPYTLAKMKPSFSRFAVLEVAPDICSWTKVGPGGYVTIHRSQRVFK